MSDTKHTAERARVVFGRPMNPCPKCGSYNLRYQTPVDVGLSPGDDVKAVVGKWAKLARTGSTPLKGPVFIMCFKCGHKGPSVDCSGRTSEDVGRDPRVASEVRRLWNEQGGPI